MPEGYIKLHRKLVDWEWYSDGNTFRVFLHLLLNANYHETKWQGITIQPGQLIISTTSFFKPLGISRQSFRTSLTKLKSTNEITTKSTNQYTLVTIVKWALYQPLCQQLTNETTTDSTNEQPTSNQRVTTSKNIENNKNIFGTALDGLDCFQEALPEKTVQSKFKPPTLDEVKSYCLERRNSVNPSKFFDFYESKGWKVGVNQMKNWKAAVRTWEQNSESSGGGSYGQYKCVDK